MKRAMEILAMLMIGDGTLATIRPRQHVALWGGRSDNGYWNRMLRWCTEHRTSTRVIGATEIVLGVALAMRQWQRMRA